MRTSSVTVLLSSFSFLGIYGSLERLFSAVGNSHQLHLNKTWHLGRFYQLYLRIPSVHDYPWLPDEMLYT